jgi:hypothetical protein
MKSARQQRVKKQPTNNMKRFSEQLHKKSQTVKLKKSEQVDLRERLVSYMEYHPLPASIKAAEVKSLDNKKTLSPILTDTFAQFAIPYQMLFKLGSVAAVFVLVIIPFMAERTIPGDTLYAVKVQFNEEVRSTLTWGSYEKVEWETTRLNRRIAEARLLADEGLLTQEAEAEVAAAVKVHSDNAKREIEVLRELDADEATIATIAFDSSLQVQAQVLQESTAASTTDTTGDLISDVLDESLEKPELTEEVAVPAYGKLMARVELNTTRVRELRDSLVGSITEQDLADVTRRIEDIDRTVGEAIALSDTEDTELAAREALVEVITRTQKLIVFMTELEVREQVTIESVVPVVPTEDEVLIDRSIRLTELESAISTLTTAIETVEDEDFEAKLADANTKLIAAQAVLTETDDYNVFVTESNAALALAADALLLLDIQGINVAETIDVPNEETSTSTATTSEEVVLEVATSSDPIPEEEIIPEVVVEPEITDATTTPEVEEDTQSEIDEEV